MTSIVELVYAPTHADLFRQSFPFVVGMTVLDLLTQSDLLKQYPDTESSVIGIFSKKVSRNTLLKPGDRVEIYRPLLCSPKERRRARAHGSFEKQKNPS